MRAKTGQVGGGTGKGRGKTRRDGNGNGNGGETGARRGRERDGGIWERSGCLGRPAPFLGCTGPGRIAFALALALAVARRRQGRLTRSTPGPFGRTLPLLAGLAAGLVELLLGNGQRGWGYTWHDVPCGACLSCASPQAPPRTRLRCREACSCYPSGGRGRVSLALQPLGRRWVRQRARRGALEGVGTCATRARRKRTWFRFRGVAVGLAVVLLFGGHDGGSRQARNNPLSLNDIRVPEKYKSPRQKGALYYHFRPFLRP